MLHITSNITVFTKFCKLVQNNMKKGKMMKKSYATMVVTELHHMAIFYDFYIHAAIKILFPYIYIIQIYLNQDRYATYNAPIHDIPPKHRKKQN